YSETVRSVRDMPLSFAAGYPDISLLPLKQVRRLFAKLRCQEAEGNDFSYQVPTGCPRLR
ncbi:MAG: hypothetical protein GWN84_19855, partial [Gammaproteobacteria bacterium]|nr:hypothetical protein [Gammaproteobacteria bacterium]NIR85077.1 hypothetical protein [Gammaproteobacteria bacterium]NIU06127.1 hypothetical protein [Gammaproteobacteria bacterium]NIV50579.1 hypothetical protein [Gammaproteobacteria bacterium]NIX87400.1 hypothetical protein [Gammaproteobacteria bacterium]